ncbi:UvrD-helicase domain-containing protein [Urechidicola vernalis]|uniref:DNA 3'-5' helicase n=1 Tax=Urechidicola vernalis TaxID=3075600 RepID=A0ABU2YAV2_9FLAO|nr:UvrD-helicase domain-containing protein [Urechidicola sp. P050]MDT0554188.1 UvrD-helicase domain-containing protein [Urechidicola sp. P050]
MIEGKQFQVYNASAGSGKTFTLVKEYLRILLTTDDKYRFQNILAITFTNKAAAEMKERVLESLKGISRSDTYFMLQIIGEESNIPNSILRNRAKNVLQTILQNYGGFNITTIDSFTHKIIRSFAFDLGLSLNFEVEMDAIGLLDEAVDVLISKIGEDKSLTDVLINYSLDKTNDDKSWDISRDLKEFARILLNEDHAKQLSALEEKTLDDYTSLKENLRKEQQRIQKRGEEIGNSGLEIINNMGLDYKDFYYSLIPKHFLSLERDLGATKFFDQSKLKERIEERNFYSKSKPDDIKTAIESILQPLLELYSESEVLYQKYVLNELVLKSLIPMAVLKQINTSLNEIKDQNNIRLNAEFNRLISDQLKDEPAPFIYERIGEKFRYYFIDEMQDTSELQWQNLIPLIENSLSSETMEGYPGKLMLVGDAKQAIYRWRGGKAEQFIQLTEQDEVTVFPVEKEVKNLAYNYRSSAEIVQFNNAFFTHVSNFFKKDSYKQLYVSGNNQKITDKEGGYVQVSFVDETVSEEKELVYPKKVLEIIEKLKLEIELSDICILVRTKKQGVAVSKFLLENEVPIISSETMLLKNNSLISFVIDVFTFINESFNKEALANALCFLNNEHLNVENTHLFLSERIELSGQDLFDSLLKYNINFNLKEFVGLPFYDATEYLIRSFNLMDYDLVFMQSLLDIILEFKQNKNSGIGDFLEFWNRKKDSFSVVMPEGQKAVQIMTIHKSKGLEFPVVILPYDLNIYREINPKIWYNNLSSTSYSDLESSLVDYSKKVRYTSTYGAQIYEDHQNELELDNLNLLYVALTRPQERLYVITNAQKTSRALRDSKSYSDLFNDFLQNHTEKQLDSNESNYEFGEKTKIQIENEKNKVSIVYQDELISSNWKNQNISIVTKASNLWDTKQEASIEYGNLIHEILSKIKTESDIEDVLKTYAREGFLDDEFGEKVKDIIEAVVKHTELKKYYSDDYEIKNEQELLSNVGEIQIPDRLCVKGGNVVVIDYKTGEQLSKHEQQISKYALTLRSLGFEIEREILVYLGKEITVKVVL